MTLEEAAAIARELGYSPTIESQPLFASNDEQAEAILRYLKGNGSVNTSTSALVDWVPSTFSMAETIDDLNNLVLKYHTNSDINQFAIRYAEMLVIGLALGAAPKIKETIFLNVKTEDLKYDRHKRIYKECVELHSTDVEVNLTNAFMGLPDEAMFMTDCLKLAYPNLNEAALFRAIDTIRISGIRRKIFKACHKLVDGLRSYEKDPIALGAEVAEQLSEIITSSAPAQRVDVVVHTQQMLTSKAIARVPTGYDELDGHLAGGPSLTDSIVIAGDTSQGKSTFAINIAQNILDMDKDSEILYVSAEMHPDEIRKKFLSFYLGRNVPYMRPEEFTPNILKAMEPGIQNLKRLHFATSTNMGGIRSEASQLKAKGHLKAIMIDYLQLVEPAQTLKTEYENVSAVSKAAKKMAKALEVPVYLLSSINREVGKRPGRRPNLKDLKSSGDIEFDADKVIFVWRPERYEIMTFDDGSPTQDKAVIILDKNRMGFTGDIRMDFNKNIQRFERNGYFSDLSTMFNDYERIGTDDDSY